MNISTYSKLMLICLVVILVSGAHILVGYSNQNIQEVQDLVAILPNTNGLGNPSVEQTSEQLTLETLVLDGRLVDGKLLLPLHSFSDAMDKDISLNLDIPTNLIDGTLYVPLIMVTQALEFPVSWQEELGATIVYTSHGPIIVRPDYLSAVPVSPQKVTNPDDYLALVNKHYSLSAEYVPGDLRETAIPFTKPEGHPSRKLRSTVASATEELFELAARENIDLVGVSGYRSYTNQKNIFAKVSATRGAERANQSSAYPGQSEHQTGLAIDVSSASVNHGLTSSFGTTREGLWVAENAPSFGFIIRYPKNKTDITGYIYEPWHLRYVGRDAAMEIAAQDVTLEEYLYNQSFMAQLATYLDSLEIE